MTELLFALAEKFRSDTIAPGIMVSWIAKKELYYISVNRFPRGLASRKILASANGPSLKGTIDAVYKMIFEGEMR